MRQVRLQGVTCGHRENFQDMLRAIAAKGVDPVISPPLPLLAGEGSLPLHGRKRHVGKIVIEAGSVEGSISRD
jgi:hypothetical protein